MKNTTLLLCLFQSLAGFLFGWEQSVISGLMIMPDFQARFGTCTADGVCAVASERQSVITGIFSIGCLVGALIAGNIATRIGLRNTNLISLFVFCIGIAVETSATTSYGQIVGGRVLTGYGVGALSGLVPVYQAEASPPHLRGVVTGSFQGCVTLGIFLCNCVNDGMKDYSGTVAWRIPISIQLVWGLILFIGFALSPESPSYFAKKGKFEESKKALARLRGLPIDSPEIEAAFEAIKVRQVQEASLGDSTYRELFSMKDRIAFRTLIGVFLQVGQQTSGINFFFSYGVQFFQSSGITDPYITQIILSAVNLIMTFPGMWIVYKFGRRQVLLYGAIVMFTGQIITGAIGTALPGQETSGKVLIAFSCIFVAGFATTWGPVVWVVCGETFPTRMSAKCVTLATASNWAMNTIIAFVVPIIVNTDGANLGPKICFVWAGFIAASYVFVLFLVPETKGLSIDQIDELYLAHIPAWRSAGFVAPNLDIEQEIQSKPARAKHDETVNYKQKPEHDGAIPDSAVATPFPSVHNL
ncbi:hexose transporter [Mrakia frigida]|uniref:sugar porter family MFS transporter n=1 Tax=Mrakia frigida TaxID=29902 RepID=UPI003FCC1CA5